MSLALFLGRQGRLNDALDLIAPIWAQASNTDTISTACLELLASSPRPTTALQYDRVAGWLEHAIKEKKGSALLVFNLANVAREQMRHDEARALYKDVTRQAPLGALSPQIVKRLLALSYNNSAWLMTLSGGQGQDALADVNRASSCWAPRPICWTHEASSTSA